MKLLPHFPPQDLICKICIFFLQTVKPQTRGHLLDPIDLGLQCLPETERRMLDSSSFFTGLNVTDILFCCEF